MFYATHDIRMQAKIKRQHHGHLNEKLGLRLVGMGTIYYYDKEKKYIYFLKDLDDPINLYTWPFLSDDIFELYERFKKNSCN